MKLTTQANPTAKTALGCLNRLGPADAVTESPPRLRVSVRRCEGLPSSAPTIVYNDLMENDSATPRALALVILRLVRGLREETSETGLSPAAASALRRLADDGPMRLTELARRENASQPATTQLVGRLEKSGLVGRAAAPEDGRAVVVSITAKGADTLERRVVTQERALERALDGLPSRDRELVAEAVPALGRLAREINRSSLEAAQGQTQGHGADDPGRSEE
ncbi:MarR family winged helix-turn-helix transcriptional regulator [Curtobacterium pusillum]